MNFFHISNLDQQEITIHGDEFRHGIKSLRKREGDKIHITDGKGTVVIARIQHLRRQEAECIILEKLENYKPLKYQLHLCVAPTKNTSRWEWLLEKCTEIGCSQFTPLICDHSERKDLKLGRSERILVSAMKQSLKAFLPKLDAPTAFDKLVQQSKVEKKLICTGGATDHLSDAYHGESSVQILIGPEGDFSEDEIGMAQGHGYIPVHLGQQRLRTETAAVVANTLIANHKKYRGPKISE